MPFLGDMLVPWRVSNKPSYKNHEIFFNDDMNLKSQVRSFFPFFPSASEPQSWPRLLDLHKAWVLWTDVSASLSAPVEGAKRQWSGSFSGGSLGGFFGCESNHLLCFWRNPTYGECWKSSIHGCRYWGISQMAKEKRWISRWQFHDKLLRGLELSKRDWMI